jgi:glycosyltransferase involved in cell wall biosynthesis
MSNAGLEAMERGLAILMSRCGGLDTYIQPGMGWIVAPEDARGLAHTLCEALATPMPTLAAMGERNRAFTLQHFGLPQVAARYLVLFESLRTTRHDGIRT